MTYNLLCAHFNPVCLSEQSFSWSKFLYFQLCSEFFFSISCLQRGIKKCSLSETSFFLALCCCFIFALSLLLPCCVPKHWHLLLGSIDGTSARAQRHIKDVCSVSIRPQLSFRTRGCWSTSLISSGGQRKQQQIIQMPLGFTYLASFFFFHTEIEIILTAQKKAGATGVWLNQVPTGRSLIWCNSSGIKASLLSVPFKEFF